jgi:S1-C subfamily serine protease
MCRLALLLIVAFGFLSGAAHGQDRPALDMALAYEQALHSAIERAEPAVVCIRISRSDAYSKRFHDQPPPDNPGKLGEFKPGRRGAYLLPAEKGPVDSGAILRRTREEAQKYDLDVQKYDLADSRTVPQDFASGVILDGRERLILTTYQAIHDATKLYVHLSDRRGSYADIYAADPRSDLAVLRLIDPQLGLLPEIKFGDANQLRKGSLVVLLVNAFAAGFREGGASAATGIVSNIRQRAAPGANELEARGERRLFMLGTLLQTDIRLQVDCSGGALVNLQGELVGLTSARVASLGDEMAGGFAIPLNARMRRIVDKLRAGLEVEYGFLGVQPVPGPDKDAIDPIAGSPAQLADFQRGDRITAVNGNPIRDQDDLFYEVATLLAGSRVRLTFVRKGQTPAEVDVTLTKSFVPGQIIAANRPAPVRGFRVDYASIVFQRFQLLTQVAPRFGWGNGRFHRSNQLVDGVCVSEVQEGSPATRADPPLQANDIITHVQVGGAQHAVHTPDEFYRLVRKLPPSAPLELTVAGTSTPVVIR